MTVEPDFSVAELDLCCGALPDDASRQQHAERVAFHRAAIAEWLSPVVFGATNREPNNQGDAA